MANPYPGYGITIPYPSTPTPSRRSSQPSDPGSARRWNATTRSFSRGPAPVFLGPDADVLLSGGLNIRGHADAVFQVTVHSYNTGSNVLLKLGICVFS